MTAEAHKRRFEAQNFGILQKDEKMPAQEYKQLLEYGAKFPFKLFWGHQLCNVIIMRLAEEATEARLSC